MFLLRRRLEIVSISALYQIFARVSRSSVVRLSVLIGEERSSGQPESHERDHGQGKWRTVCHPSPYGANTKGLSTRSDERRVEIKASVEGFRTSAAGSTEARTEEVVRHTKV